MPTAWPPSKEADLAVYTPQFSAKITATPTAYNLTAANATAFASLSTAWVNAYNLASDPATRTKATVAAKNLAKTNVVANLRLLARLIEAGPSVTVAQKEELGIPAHDTRPTPIPAPAVAPSLTVVSAAGNTVRIRLADATSPARRGRPANVAGAEVYSFVGDNPPADLAGWRFEGNTTRTTVDVAFPTTVPAGAKVWFRARWFNPRLQDGPLSPSIPFRILGDVAQAA